MNISELTALSKAGFTKAEILAMAGYQPQPAQYSQPQPAQYSQPQPAQYSQPQPAQYSQPQPAQYSQPQPAQYSQPQPAQYSQPQPAQYSQSQPAQYTQPSYGQTQNISPNGNDLLAVLQSMNANLNGVDIPPQNGWEQNLADHYKMLMVGEVNNGANNAGASAGT